MFENILSQAAVVESLRGEINAGTLPNVLLFEGPQYSGKLSTALEFGRVISCELDARWNCGCAPCVRHRELVHGDTLMLGDRYFLQEIRVTGDSMQTTRSDPGIYLFLRAVRKLLRRFDPVLWESEENRLSKYSAAVEAIEETLQTLVPGRALPSDRSCRKSIDTILTHAAKLVAALPREGIPVQMVRNLSAWAHIAPQGRAKLAIIERVDRLREGARNALLKTLEEPAHDVCFVLATTNRGAVADTILSRARTYRFAERDRDQAGEVMERIFRISDPQFRSLREFFVRASYPGSHSPTTLARQFLEHVIAPKGVESYEKVKAIEQELREAGGEEWLHEFLREVLQALHGILRAENAQPGEAAILEAPISLDQIERWNSLVRRSLQLSDNLRLSISSVLDSLYFSMRSA